ncbi:MAG: hypothetical protein ACI8Z1_001102 [Candidatus Azotimanducaceae bacterium]|jgi:hypothetical protein
MTDIIRIGNCSGYYGDRLSAAREMIEQGHIDVLTGDYLAELTMTILYNQMQTRGPDKGYVATFLKQLADVARDCAAKNIKIVTNAGGLNPSSMATEVERILKEQNVDLKVAYIDGDDIKNDIQKFQDEGETFTNLDRGTLLSESSHQVLTANTYLGAWGIKEALDQGADIVICPRVTDAALVIGPAAWKFNWQRDNYDALAGALAAGHIIECGAQCCGGNYSFFEEVPSFRNVGYPIAEMESDGSFTVTKHPGTGGLVSVGTITAQLLYEIKAPAYLNPDVIAHFDTMKIEQTDEDRVRVSECKGSSPPPTHKVCVNTQGEHKQSLEVLLTGLDIEKKAALYTDQVFFNLGGTEQYDDVDIQLIRSDKANPATNEEAHAALRITVTSSDPDKLGRLFQAKITELGLAAIPGNTGRGAAGYNGAPVIAYWPTLIDSQKVTESVHFAGVTTDVLPTQRLDYNEIYYQEPPISIPELKPTQTKQIPFGRLFGTRSGDKGGAANCGVWARSFEAYQFLYHYLTIEQFKVLAPDMASYRIERFEMPNLRALNFYIHDVLGEGVSSNHRIDKQAKSFGEYLRAKIIMVPEHLTKGIS